MPEERHIRTHTHTTTIKTYVYEMWPVLLVVSFCLYVLLRGISSVGL